MTRRLPLWAVFALDLLVLVMALTVFCYFHHIRELWFAAPSEVVGMETAETTATESEKVPASPETTAAETSGLGSFASSLPDVFLKEGEPFLSENNGEIRRYLKEHALPEPDIDDLTIKSISYEGLYQSGSVYLTASKLGMDIRSDGKTYELTFFLYDVYIKNIENLFTVAVSGDRRPIEELSQDTYRIVGKDGGSLFTSPAVLAVNGDYFGNDKLVKYAVRNGRLLRNKSEEAGADLCVLYYDGRVETFSAEAFDPKAVQAEKPYQIWEFGPNLLDEAGNAFDEYDASHYGKNVITGRHPRTAFGYYEPGHYCFVVADGRSEASDGLRITWLAELMDQLDCQIAYNLDGGDSAQSLFNGKRHRVDEDRVEKGDDQRELYDIICIGEVSAE